VRAVLALLLLAGCAAPVAPVDPAPAGAAEAACTAQIARRSGGSARIAGVQLFEGQRGIVTARAPFGTEYTCFTDAQGRAVHVAVDRRRF